MTLHEVSTQLHKLSVAGYFNGEKFTIAIPNDTTNEARALMLLQDNGYIKLKDGVDITATARDVEAPDNIEFKEVEVEEAEEPAAPAEAAAAAAAASAAGSGLSTTRDSVVRTQEAMEAAFSREERVTLVGSTMPQAIMSQYSSV